MLDEIVGGLFKVLIRFLGQIFVEILFEILIKGAGSIIVRPFTRSAPDSDSFVVVVVGLVFWALVIFGAVMLVPS